MMPSIDNAYPSVVVRHPSGVSRFNERFSDSSTSGYQAEPSKCGSCLQTLIKRLKANSDLQNGTLRSTPVYLRTTQSTVARRRSKGTPSATAAAYARRRSTAKQLAENHGHAKRAKQKHEKVQKQKSRLTGATWGYDPTAGRIAHPTSLGNEYGLEEIDSLGRRTGRRWLAGSEWGIETGGPGREPQVEPSEVGQYQAASPLKCVSSAGSKRLAANP